MPGERLRAVELFASGVYRGKRYTFADVDQIAANAVKLGPVGLRPPAVVGHEEERPDGTPTAAPEPGRTDIPAEGWVDTSTVRAVWKRDGTGDLRRVLIGDLTDVPPQMAADIRAKRFRKVSAEVYDDFLDDAGRGHGKALRRISYLGGEVPQVKGLADLPMPVAFAERLTRLKPTGGRLTKDRTFVAFSEVTPMDRAQLIAAIQQIMPGLLPATLEAMSDDQLADLAKNIAAPAPPPATPMNDGGTRDEIIAKLAATGQDPTALAAKTDDELKAMLAAVAPPAPPAATMSEKAKAAAAAAEKMAEQAEARAKRALERAAKTEQEAKQKEAETFCESLVKQGRLLPAQKDRVLGDLISQDDVAAVHKFTENGQSVTLTAFEKAKRDYAAWPVVVRFAEKVPTSPQKADEREIAAVQKFADVQGEALKKAGKTPKQYVEKFSELRKKDPDLTAEKYGVPADYYE